MAEDEYVSIPRYFIEHESEAHRRFADETRRLLGVLTDLAKLAASPGGLAEHAEAATKIIEQATHKIVPGGEQLVVMRKAMLEDGSEETRQLRETVNKVGNVLDRVQSQGRSTLSPNEVKDVRQQIEGVRNDQRIRQSPSTEHSHSRSMRW